MGFRDFLRRAMGWLGLSTTAPPPVVDVPYCDDFIDLLTFSDDYIDLQTESNDEIDITC